MPGHFIDGKWIEGNGSSFSSKNPATGEKIWEGKEATSSEIDLAVQAAEQAFVSWRSLSLDKRVQIIQKFQKLLGEEKESLAELISQDVGKPLWESRQEVESMIGKIPISLEAYENRCPLKEIQKNTATITTNHKPHGVLAIIGPFNFPGHLPNGHLIPALIAGNTVILKGSEKAPTVTEKIASLWEKAEIPEGVFNIVQGGKEVGNQLAIRQKITGLCFTGSYKVGKTLMEALGPLPQKIIALEMGGNNPLVISTIADYETAAYLTIQSAFITSGQRCSCARRLILVEGSQSEAFLKTLIHMTELLQVGAYNTHPEPFMGPVISNKVAESALDQQNRLESHGGVKLIGMTRLKEKMPFLSAGIIDTTEIHSRNDEEVFAPLLQVIRVKTFEEAILEANRTNYGLTASLFSDSKEEFEEFFSSIDAGVINWNMATTGASSSAPFGGLKQSGNYRPSGYYAADYSAYPVASCTSEVMHLPKPLTPGVAFLATT